MGYVKIKTTNYEELMRNISKRIRGCYNKFLFGEKYILISHVLQ